MTNMLLRAARKQNAWSQKQLADFAELSLSTVERAERGKAIRADNIQALCACLGESPQQLGLLKIEDSVTKDVKKMDANKRNTMRKIGTVAAGSLFLGSEPFGATQTVIKLHDEEVLSLCKAHFPTWWRLYFEGYHAEIRKILPSYLFRLSTLADRPSRHQQLAANLASQGHQLAYMLAIQQQNFLVALMHTNQAFQYGVLAEDFNLQVSALIRQGYVYYLANDPDAESMLYFYQKAFQYRDKVPPLLQGRIYVGLAKSHAFLKQEQEALHFIGLVHDTFPEHPEKESAYAYTHWDSFTPANYEVVSYLQLNQPKNAWKVCGRIANMGTEVLRTTKRVELLVRQAETSLALGELQQTCGYVEQAVTSALELGSDLRYNESHNIYTLMRKKWPREKTVKSLANLFS